MADLTENTLFPGKVKTVYFLGLSKQLGRQPK